MSTRLSKSRFQKGLQCEKALWLSVHEPESADPITESKQWVFDQGTEVGRVAHGLFPGGTEVTDDYLHSTEALATTAQLLSEGVRVLYEPAFSYDGVLVRVDILVAVDDGSDEGSSTSTRSSRPRSSSRSTSRMPRSRPTSSKVRACEFDARASSTWTTRTCTKVAPTTPRVCSR